MKREKQQHCWYGTASMGVHDTITNVFDTSGDYSHQTQKFVRRAVLH
jgi:hypothetical protein